jgi:hypothetical protein
MEEGYIEENPATNLIIFFQKFFLSFHATGSPQHERRKSRGKTPS